MRYIIDTANDEQIQEALDMGACGVTANPSMYLKNQQNFYEFVKKYAALQLPFFSAEVMEGALEEMRAQAQFLSEISPEIIIKLNFSKNALYQKALHQKLHIDDESPLSSDSL